MREELYSGRHMDIAPDIVFLTASGYRAERDINQRYTAVVPLDILEKYSGLHDLNGIFVANGGTIERGIVLEGAEIVDVAPTALYALGVPVPRGVDGRILMEIFRPSYVESHPPQYRDMPITAPTGPSDFGLSEEEEQEVRDKLRGLGYLS
jgi:hypothetical protein